MRTSFPDIVLTNGTLIDGTGNPPIEGAAIVIHQGCIQSVGTQYATTPGALVIDVEGRTILPGFFNTHVHRAFKADALRAWAREGVTTVRDLGASLRRGYSNLFFTKVSRFT